MKKLRIALCALFVLCSGFVFAACAEDNKNFEVGKIEVVQDEFLYDGNAHAITFKYPDTKLQVKYSLETDEDNFKSLEELGIKNAGTYNVYYKLSAEGYNTYVSEQTIEFTINPIDITVNVGDVYVLLSDINETVTPTWTREGTVLPNESLDMSFEIGSNKLTSDEFDVANVSVGDVYNIVGTAANTNYNVTYEGGYVYVIDAVQLVSDSTVSFYSNLKEAIAAAEAGDEIVLHKDIELTSVVDIDKSITINGRGKYSIKASNNYIDSNMLLVNTDSAVVTLKNVTVNGNNKARVVKVSAGKLVVDNSTITGGMAKDYVGGVFVTGASQFEMISGTISGNNCLVPIAEREYYHTYSTDLWIGSQAQGSLVSIYGGTVGKVFVNANEYTSQNASFKLNGGVVHKVYVEYDKGYGATFDYVSGYVDELLISTKGSGEFIEEDLVPNTVYKGGVVAIKKLADGTGVAYWDTNEIEKSEGEYVTAFVYSKESLLEAYEYADEIVVVSNIGSNDSYIGDIRLSATSKNYDIVIDLNGKTIAAELDFVNYAVSTGYSEYGIEVSIVDNSSNKYDEKTGVVGCQLNDYGIMINGNDKISVTLDGVKLQGKFGGIYSNGRCEGASIVATNCAFKGSADSVGAYLAANYEYTFTNCEFVGATGYYTKSGNHTLSNCSFKGTMAEYYEENFNGNGAELTGSAVVIDSAKGYKTPMVVVLTNCEFESVAGYCVEEFATSNSTETCYATVSIDNSNFESYGKAKAVYTENNVVTGVNEENLEVASK